MKKRIGFVLLVLLQSSLWASSLTSTQNSIAQLIKPFKASVGVAFIDVQTNDTFSLNNHILYPTQSVYKFPLALYTLKLVEEKKLSLEQVVDIPSNMSNQFGWSPLKNQHPEKAIKLSIDQLIYYAVAYSDNLACDMLFDLVGGTDKVNNYLKSIGHNNIKLTYTELQIYAEAKRMYKNTTSPMAMCLLLKEFEAGKLLSGQHTSYLLNYMTNKYNSPARIRGNLPPGVQVAHKTGTGSYDNIINACNDVGIITLPNQHKIILSVFVKDAREGFDVTEQLIANIAQLIYESYVPKPNIINLTNIGNNEAAGNYITLNQTKHYYETYGKGEPLLLIHGNSTPTRGWAPQIEYFSSFYKVYSIDCRGRGKSELGNDSLTYLQQAEDLSLFLEKLQLDSVCIIGKSDGAIIGLLMAIHHPERLKKLVAFSGNLQPDTTALYPETVNEIKQARALADSKLTINDTTKNWRLEQQRNRMMEFQPNITASDLQKITIPVLVMSGDRDVIKIEHSLFIYKNLSKGNLCILPNQQHGLPKLNPLLFNTTVKAYLETTFKPDSFRFEH